MALGLDDDQLDLQESEVSDITFGSAEARFALLRARRLRLVLHVAAMAAVLLAATVTAVTIRLRRDGGFASVSNLLGGQDGLPKLNIDPVGSEDAKVKIVAVLPGGSDCHSGVAKFLVEIATARPEEIRVDFVSIDEFAVKEPQLQRKIGQPCAAVVINEEVDFQLVVGGKIRAVNLVGNEPANYRIGDVGEAITQVYKKQYGDPGEPIYKLEQKSCAAGAGACGVDHAHPATQEPEAREPITITLPGKLPDIQGLK